ncbi:hypothetical protein ACVILI_001538 [Mesorhizobium sp. USDA 4775]
MAEQIKIKIHPSGTSSDMLTVADAMRQVLDFIELLEKSDPAEPGSADRIVWRLSYATTNSPFEIGAEATSKDPTISIAAKARMVKTSVRRVFGRLFDDNGPAIPIDLGDIEPLVARILERNTNGIGETDFDFGEDVEPSIIVHSNASRALRAIESGKLFAASLRGDLTRTEYGAFEGEIVSTGMFHNSPSVVVRHRLSGDKVTCVFPAEFAYQIGSKHSWFEVWAGKRALIHGELHYDDDGRLKRVNASDLELIGERDIDLATARRENLTEGTTTQELLERGWPRTNDG